jgi:hypothetical protein
MDSDHIEPDPGLRIPIDGFHPNIRDEVRLAYVAKVCTQMKLYYRYVFVPTTRFI